VAYPRLLNLDDETKARLISLLNDNLNRHIMERDIWVQDLIRWQADYWSSPITERATFPFTGASTIIVPLDAIAVETIHARVMTQLFGLTQFVSAKALNPDWEDYTHVIEKVMDHVLIKDAKCYKPLNSSILEIIKFGTGIAKGGYERITKTAVRQVGELEQEFDVVIKDGPTIDAVALSRFMMPFSALDPQTAPWCGEEHAKGPYEVKLLEESGFFYPNTMEVLKTWVAQSAVGTQGRERKTQRAQEQLEHKVAIWPKLLDWYEMWLAFDVDGSGTQKEICVHYHKGAQYLLSVRYNWHEDLHRPYRVGVYFPVEHRWTGVGVCKQNEQFQKEITTQHRQRLDNATLANMMMLKVHKMSGYGPKEPIFPGKMWFLDDMSHVEPFTMSEIHESTFANEQATLVYSQQRTGVNEVTLGMPSVGTPGTATSDIARIQEGTKKFDFTYKNTKQFVDELVVDTACNVQQFGMKNVRLYASIYGGDKAKEFFSQPQSIIRDNILLELTSAGQQSNKLIDRQNWTQIAQMLQNYYAGMIQLAELMQQPQLIAIIGQKGLVAATEAMRQMLETFDIPNVDKIAMTELLRSIGGGNNASNTSPTNGVFNGANAGPQISGQAPGILSSPATVPQLGVQS